MEAAQVARMPHCASCGWNVNAARKQTRQMAIAWGIGVVGLVALLGLWVVAVHPEIYLDRNNFITAVSAIACWSVSAGIALVMWLRTQRRMKELDVPFAEAMGRSGAAGGANAGAAESEDGSDEENDEDGDAQVSEEDQAKAKAAEDWQRRETEAELREVAAMAVPRRIGVGKGCTPVASMIGVLAGIGVALSMAGSNGRSPGRWRGNVVGPPLPRPILVAIGLAGLCYFVYQLLGVMRERRLVSRGAVALGTIVDVKPVRFGSPVTYRFVDAEHRTVTSGGGDISRCLRPGMCVMVFYDAANPEKNAPECGLEYRVADVAVKT